VTFEGDGAAQFRPTSNTSRKWTHGQAGIFTIEHRVRFSADSGTTGYVFADRFPGTSSMSHASVWLASTDGRISVIDGVGNGSKPIEDTGFTWEPDRWHTIRQALDVRNRTWRFFFDDVEYVGPDPLGFRGTVTAVNGLDILSHTSGAGTYLDQLQITTADEQATLEPSHYLAFDDSQPAAGTSVSPFSHVDFSAGYFHLEDFEDGALNTPGVSASRGEIRGPGDSTVVDSVDADDGAIDGSGSAGHALKLGSLSEPSITFTFNESILGSLPTHAGVVWTDGENDARLEAFDVDGFSLGSVTAAPATAGVGGETDEDTFLGVAHAGGISRMTVTGGVDSGAAAGIEVDHLQYGRVPEPSVLTFVGVAFGGLVCVGLRRLRERRVAGYLRI